MRFQGFRAVNFRNFEQIGANFPAGAQFICGRNGQGKTNLLEALGYVTSLRSFRISETSALIRWEAQPRETAMVYDIDHDNLGQTTLEIRLKPGSKQVFLDGSPVRKLSEILGYFPTITFSSQDIQILRGSPSLRRRMMDMMFVMMDPAYYGTLTRYFRALKSRNALLKQRAPSNQLKPFEDCLVQEGWSLMALRRQLLDTFLPHFASSYRGISGVEEQPVLVYKGSIDAEDPDAYEHAFLTCKRRDVETATTNKGPHRDDLEIRLQEHTARDFASEGQQRGLVLALRMGMVAWYRQAGGTHPVILADDIVGELDAGRRRGFWRMLGTECQILATGTAFPLEDDFHQWNNWNMEDGQLSLAEKEELA
jgi:DNA replication and repair protein RecF